MKKTLIAVATLLSFNVLSFNALADNQIQNATKNTAYVKTNKGAGTGFFIKNTKLMITNKHVANKGSFFIGILDSNGEKYYGRHVFSSLDYDLSLIEVYNKDTDTLINNNTDLRYNGGLALCDNSNANVNDEIFGIGSPASQRHVYRKGYINSANSFSIQHGHEVVQYQEYTGKGTSGGAIIHKEKDCVLGVNFAGLLEYDMGIAVPVEFLKTVLSDYTNYSKLNKREKVVYDLERLIRYETKQYKKFVKKAKKEQEERIKSIKSKKGKMIEHINILIKEDKESN